MSTVDAAIIKYITNGGASNGAANGGSSSHADVLLRWSYEYGSIRDNDYEIFIGAFSEMYPAVIKLFNKNTQTIDTLYVIMMNDRIFPHGDTTNGNNIRLMDENNNIKYYARIFMDGMDGILRIRDAATTFDTFNSSATDLGIFRFTHMSYDTMMKFVCYTPVAREQ